MEKKKKFDFIKYKTAWNKENKKQFKVDLNIKEYEELCNILNKKNISKVQFVRNALEELKKK